MKNNKTWTTIKNIIYKYNTNKNYSDNYKDDGMSVNNLNENYQMII